MGDRPAGASGGSTPMLGRYHLAEPLGGGPTGEVFRAKVYGVAGYERQYAVKRFHPALAADPAAAEILAAAARTYATVAHPHIARLAEYGVAAGQSFVAVELVSGVDLARLVAGTTAVGDPVPRGALLTMMVQVARAVAYAHSRGVVHGGLSPTNVILSSDGDPKLTDFGFLRARLRGRPAEDPTLAARLPYLSPEQLDGVPATPASDVFVLATVICEVLTGERCFVGRGPAQIAAAVRAGPRELTDVSTPVWEALRQAFAPLDARFANGGAFADAFEAAVRKLGLPGGRSDLAAAVKRVNTRSAELLANASGALSFPLPAPPPSTPGVPLSTLFAGGEVPKFSSSIRTTLQGMAVSPPPPPAASDSQAAAAIDALAPITLETPAVDAPSATVEAAARPPVYGRDPPSQRARRTTLPPPIPPMDPAEPAPLIMGAGLPRRRSRLPIVVLALATLGGVGYLVYDQVVKPGDDGAATMAEAKARTASPTPDPTATPSANPTPTPIPNPAAIPDATPTLNPTPIPEPTPAPEPIPTAIPAPNPIAAPDAAPAAVPAPAAPDAAAAAAPVPTPAPAPDGKLLITSKPAGAAVYLDGAAKGKTPLELPASNDRHKLAVLLAGHKLARLDVDGHGRTDVALEAADKLKGPAGIKVRCVTRNRFYVIVDGQHSGLFCPTERINVELGEHTIEIYDALSDATTVHKVPVRETHNSVRLTVEP